MEPKARPELKGSICAIVTPFAEGTIDEEALCALVAWHIEQGTHGLVPVGTTGESPTLTPEEHVAVIAICVEEARGRIPIIAGTGSNATHEAIHFTREAEKAGADAALVVTPYYNKPTQEGLYQHYKALAAATSLPILIYNIPGRSVIDMSVDTMARLAQIPNIVGVKDATTNMTRVSEQRAACGEDFIQLSGEDGTALGFMAHGGRGCISVTANVAPALCARFQEACLGGDFVTALALQDRLYPLHKALFLETSPAPVKYALSLLGKCREDLRLPLVPVKEATRDAVRAALAEAGLVDTAGHPLT